MDEQRFQSQHYTPIHRMGRTKFTLIFFSCQLIGLFLSGQFGLIVGLVIGLPVFAWISMDRLHDFNKSGWWWLVAFVPVANLILLLVLIFKAGDVGENTFGMRTRTNIKLPNLNIKPTSSDVPPLEKMTLENQLRKLKEMFDHGLISEEAYKSGQKSAVEKFTAS